jgi:shikimate kinase
VDTPPPENVVLIGFMGSGKSSIGRLAAKALGYQFVDTDQLIVERSGRQISEIFAEDGEEAFRELETAVIRSLVHLNRSVISTGGGAVIRAVNREMLRHAGFVVCLTASEDVIFERVSRNSKRPLLQCDNPRAVISQLLMSRREAYEAAAHCTIDTSLLSQGDAVEVLTAAISAHFEWNRPN